MFSPHCPQGDMPTIRRAIVAGSLLPCALFVLWEGVMLPLARPGSGDDPLALLLQVGGREREEEREGGIEVY